MNVTLAITHYPPSLGGAQSYARSLARALTSHVDHVSVVTQSTHARPDWLYGPTLDSPGPRHFFDGPVEVHALGASAVGRLLLWLPVNAYRHVPSLASLILRCYLTPQARTAIGQCRSVVHGMFLDMDYFNEMVWRTARHIGARYVVTPFVHPSEWEKQERATRTRILRAADAVVAMTPSEKKWLTRRGVAANRIHVIGAGPELDAEWDGELFRRRYGISKHMVLFVGRQRPEKGVAALMRSAPLVWEKVPDTTFVFLGPPSPTSASRFQSMCDARVLNLGSVSLKEKTSAYAACDIFCLPSSVESFGCVYVEAWMMGKPVIGGPCASTRDLIEDGHDGFVVEARPRDIADRVLQLLSDPDLRRTMGANGRAKACRQYQWDVLGMEMGRLYESL